ncbi:flagellar motor protein MotB [Paenibacillus sp. 1P07SE]|uniref:flagellar motor protein MotB n=1 Tax=Paenibacillus sp. 1P07SE TaxID=3132209 RepID=UPI0039A61235
MSKRHKHNDHEEHADESWLIPYADLMTLLLALFIVLYSMSAVDAKKFEEMSEAFTLAFNTGSGVLDSPAVIRTGPQTELPVGKAPSDGPLDRTIEEQRKALMQKEQQDLEELKRQLDEYIRDHGLTTQLETQLNLAQLMLVISDNALFASGSATVKSESRELGLAIGKMLSQYPDYEVVVSGHTDTEPIATYQFESNWDLSGVRASRFLGVILTVDGLDPERFSAVGHGETQPVASNGTVEGRAKNRRVEVSIIRKYVDTDNIQEIPATVSTQ